MRQPWRDAVDMNSEAPQPKENDEIDLEEIQFAAAETPTNTTQPELHAQTRELAE